MKHTLWIALATGLAGLTGLHAMQIPGIITTTPLSVAQPVTIVNDNASDQARAHANVNFVDNLYTNQRIFRFPTDPYATPSAYPVMTPLRFQYDEATQKVLNNGNANNSHVSGAQSDAPRLYVQ